MNPSSSREHEVQGQFLRVWLGRQGQTTEALTFQALAPSSEQINDRNISTQIFHGDQF